MAFDRKANSLFFERLGEWARSLQGDLEEGERLIDVFFKQDLTNSGSFLGVGGMTKQEAINMITLAQELVKFYKNQVVTTGDRLSNITAFLAMQGKL